MGRRTSAGAALLVAAGAAIACSGDAETQADRFPMELPVVWAGACPFECCTYGQWVADSTIAVVAEEGGTGPAAFTIQPGESFEALTGNVHVLEPAEIVTVDTIVQVLPGADTLRLSPGDTVYALDYLGEGYFRLWWEGRVVEVEAFWPGLNASEAERAAAAARAERAVAVTEWWVRVRNASGQEGWFEVGSSARFHGADACG